MGGRGVRRTAADGLLPSAATLLVRNQAESGCMAQPRRPLEERAMRGMGSKVLGMLVLGMVLLGAGSPRAGYVSTVNAYPESSSYGNYGYVYITTYSGPDCTGTAGASGIFCSTG